MIEIAEEPFPRLIESLWWALDVGAVLDDQSFDGAVGLTPISPLEAHFGAPLNEVSRIAYVFVENGMYNLGSNLRSVIGESLSQRGIPSYELKNVSESRAVPVEQSVYELFTELIDPAASLTASVVFPMATLTAGKWANASLGLGALCDAIYHLFSDGPIRRIFAPDECEYTRACFGESMDAGYLAQCATE